MNRNVHLVLGSGGARGMAHIGVIQCLQHQQYIIKSIAGCSMGAVVGGIYAAGYLADYTLWLKQLTKTNLITHFDFTFQKGGFLKGEKIFETLQNITGDPLIEQFNLPFTAVATDLNSLQEVWYNQGPLYQALRASIAIPGVFIPVTHQHQLLVDGGVLNPLPLNAVRKENDDLIVAVNLNALSPITKKAAKNQQQAQPWYHDWLKKLNIETGNNQEQVQSNSVIELLENSYHLTQHRLTELMLDRYQPDILIDIPKNACSTFEFYRATEMIELGYKTCQQALKTQQQAP